MSKIRYSSLILSIALFANAQSTFSNNNLVNISRNMYLQCKGSGEPVVLLIAGYRERGDFSWDTLDSKDKNTTVFAKVSQFTKVCLYDRPGTIKEKVTTFDISRSSPVLQPITAKDAVADLHAMLHAADLKPPYVIAAHSAGGLIARLYAGIYPKEVSGMILVDVTTEALKDKWTPEEWEIYEKSTQMIPPDLRVYHDLEHIDFEQSMKQLKANEVLQNKLPMPAVVLTADQKPIAASLIEAGFWPAHVTQATANHIFSVILKSQEDLAKSFIPKAKQITNTHSGHNIQKERPQLVIDAILDVVTALRHKKID